MTKKKSKRWLTFAVIVGLVLLVELTIAPRLTTYRAQIAKVHSNLEHILTGLQEYRLKYGQLPYHDRGTDYALYGLHEFVEPRIFDDPFRDDPKDETSAAYWDHDEKRLRNNAVLYSNMPDKVIHREKVALLQVKDDGTGYFATLGGRVEWVGRKYAVPDFLGSFVTKNFVVANEEVYNQWAQTHESNLGEGVWTSTATQKHLTSVQCRTASISFYYEDVLLSKCLVTTPKGTIEEFIETDDLGRITKITRKPENWKELLPDY